jgi:hypothetical protein
MDREGAAIAPLVVNAMSIFLSPILGRAGEEIWNLQADIPSNKLKGTI